MADGGAVKLMLMCNEQPLIGQRFYLLLLDEIMFGISFRKALFYTLKKLRKGEFL